MQCLQKMPKVSVEGLPWCNRGCQTFPGNLLGIFRALFSLGLYVKTAGGTEWVRWKGLRDHLVSTANVKG